MSVYNMDESETNKYSTVGDPNVPGTEDIPGEWEVNADGSTYNLKKARAFVDVYNDDRSSHDGRCRDCSKHHAPNIEVGGDTYCGLKGWGKQKRARRHLVPRRRDADLRLVPVVVTHADRTQHRPRRRLLHAVGDVARPWLDVDRGGHYTSPPLGGGCSSVG